MGLISHHCALKSMWRTEVYVTLTYVLNAENRLVPGFDNSPDIRASKQRYGTDYRQHLHERVPHQHSSEDTLTLTEPKILTPSWHG